MRNSQRRFVGVVLALALLGSVAPAFAQTEPTTLQGISAATLRDVWKRVAQDDPSAVRQLSGAQGPKAKQAEFEKLLRRFLDADEFKAVRLEELMSVIDELPESANATSTNAALTNPASNQLVERSGLTNLLALSSDFKNFLSSDGTAVSLSLNAIALFGGAESTDGQSAPVRYARHEGWRRLGGTVTFGAKISEKEITGISGLPNADTLFDALSWDVKLRLIGDRDSRASRWAPLLIGKVGERLRFLTRLQTMGLVDATDEAAFLAAANAVLGKDLGDAKDEIASSLQVSVKTAGTHLTKVSGRNKYTVAAMLDKGFSNVDLTINASYNTAESTNVVTGPFSAKDFQVAVGLTGSVLKNRLVSGRAAELTASFKGQLIKDGANATVNRRNMYNLNATIALPFQEKGKIPLSLTWTNDPNNLTKHKYIQGQVGLSYDFGSIMGLLK